MIWNNKRYEIKPLLINSDVDRLLAEHRRWYNQFYSENSARIKVKETGRERIIYVQTKGSAKEKEIKND